MNKDEHIKKKGVPVLVAAKVMGKDPQFVRFGLQNGKLPFGYAYKVNGSSTFSYYISPKQFYDVTGYMYEQEEKNTSEE